jgi:hypothetical protein
MRFGAFIAVVYIVFLLTQPCADVFAMHAERETRPVMQAVTLDECEESGEACSPFCVCSCCSVPASYQHFSVSKGSQRIAAVSSASNFDYTNPFTASFHASVWQPPKR